MRALVALSTVVGLLVVATGCGPTCQSTCVRVYDECGITKPGQGKDELLRDCINECQSALNQSGEVGDYNPNQPRSSGGQSIVLENELQAATWMDCVWDIAPDATADQCEDLDPSVGYCAPI